MAVYGVDGCRAGWFFVRADGNHLNFGVVSQLKELVNEASDDSTVLIDIPIGLRDQSGGPRLCDRDARTLLGHPRGSSVFPAPIRAILTEPTHASATAKNRELTGRGISQQSFAIIPKIKEIDDLLAGDSRARQMLREVHPELCFWGFNHRQPMRNRKKVRAGHKDRLAVLCRVLPGADELYANALQRFLRKQVARDDILDALVAVATADYSVSPLQTLPERPEIDSRGLAMEMVYVALAN